MADSRGRRQAVPWEQQHISTVKVIGRVKTVMPVSFRELHFVVDCDPGGTASAPGSSPSSSSHSTTSPSSSSSAVTTKAGGSSSSQRNWVDVHAVDTWAARCGLLMEGDRVEMQHFGVFRPQTMSSVLSAPNTTNTPTSPLSANTTRQQNVNASTSSSSPLDGTNNNGQKQVLGSSATTTQFWSVPESRMHCPFVLAPMTTSSFLVERGQKLILHDASEDSSGDVASPPTGFNEGEQGGGAGGRESELALRAGGSRTPQQLFMKSMESSMDQNNAAGGGGGGGGKSGHHHQHHHSNSVGHSVGKNLFANVFRFVDVMRGLNSHMMALLKKVLRTCAGSEHILDAGCGSGLISFAVKCSDPGPEIVATDRSRAMSSLVQEKNNTFAGLINKGLLKLGNKEQSSPTSPTNYRHPSPASASAAAAGGITPQRHQQMKNAASSSSEAPLVQFVLGDLSAPPERFVVLPTGTHSTEVAVGGRKQFDTILCLDVLSFLPSVEAMKRALFNMVLHAKPHAKLLLSVPNLPFVAESAAKLTMMGQSAGLADAGSAAAAAAAAAASDTEGRPKIQRSMHFDYDRHSLSLGSSVQLSHGGCLDVVERQWFDIVQTSSSSFSSSSGENNDQQQQQGPSGVSSPLGRDTSLGGSVSSPPPNAGGAGGAGGGGDSLSSPMNKNDSNLLNNTKRTLRRMTEWFGFSCPTAQHGSRGATETPQIFYEQMEELILHPSVLETMFEDMGWKVEEVWLFQALERGGEFAAPAMNTMAVLGAVPGSAKKMRPSDPDSNKSATTGKGGENTNLESQFTHRMYTLSRKTQV